MTTNINRLHAVLEGRLTGRRCGKTTAVCHLIAGAVEMGESRIDILLSHLGDREHFFRILQEVLWDHGMSSNFSVFHGTGIVWQAEAKIQTYVAGFELRPECFFLWDARRHAYPRLIEFEEYLQSKQERLHP